MAHPEKLRDMAVRVAKKVGDMNLHRFGTGSSMDSGVVSGNLPTRNFRDGNFPDPDAIDAKTVEKTIRIGMDACYACPVRCKKLFR